MPGSLHVDAEVAPRRCLHSDRSSRVAAADAAENDPVPGAEPDNARRADPCHSLPATKPIADTQLDGRRETLDRWPDVRRPPGIRASMLVGCLVESKGRVCRVRTAQNILCPCLLTAADVLHKKKLQIGGDGVRKTLALLFLNLEASAG